MIPRNGIVSPTSHIISWSHIPILNCYCSCLEPGTLGVSLCRIFYWTLPVCYHNFFAFAEDQQYFWCMYYAYVSRRKQSAWRNLTILFIISTAFFIYCFRYCVRLQQSLNKQPVWTVILSVLVKHLARELGIYWRSRSCRYVRQ